MLPDRRRQSHGRRRYLRHAAVFLMTFALLISPSGCGVLDDLRERRTETIITVTRTTVPPEMQTDGNSSLPSISADGRFVAFTSNATNLIIASTNGATGIYVKDTKTGKTTHVSTSTNDEQADNDSGEPVISGDGRFVAFHSLAANLVPGDVNAGCTTSSGAVINCPDVFVKDLETGATVLVSAGATGVQGDRDSSQPAISADGRLVAFRSAAANLVAGDGNQKRDIFIKDTQTGAIERVSVDGAGAEANDESVNAALSADGRLVAFSSTATNLVPDDTNGKPDVFVKDRLTGAVTRVSTGAGGEQADDSSGSEGVALAAAGGFVAFESSATNLVPGDTNAKKDVFVKDLQTGAITRVSVDAAGQEGAEDSYGSISISGDGLKLAFRSDAPNLVPGDTNARADIFLRDMQANMIVLISGAAGGVPGNGASERVALAGNGLAAVFDSASANLIADDTNKKLDIFFKALDTGLITRVSTSTSEV